MEKDLEGSSRGIMTFYSYICLEQRRKTMKNISLESWCSGRGSNRLAVEYECKALPLHQPTRSQSIFSDDFKPGCKPMAISCISSRAIRFTDFETDRGDINVPEKHGTQHCEDTSLHLKGEVRFKCNSQKEIKLSPRN